MATKTATESPSLITVLRSARADLKAFVERGIDLAEKRTKTTAKAVFKFARTVTKRLGGEATKRAK